MALVDAEGRDWSRIASLWRSAGYSARSEKSLEGRTEQPTSRSLSSPTPLAGLPHRASADPRQPQRS